ncbi:MAG: FAD-binding protein, partial [Pseudomonadales bacterium]
MALSRRTLLATGAITAAVGIPVVQHVSWSKQSFKRDGFVESPPGPPEGRRNWSNWSGIERATPHTIAVPANDAELAELIRNSTDPIRPVGTGHSFTGLVPSDGIIVDVSRFTGLLTHDPVAMTATFGAGTRLRQASRALSEVGLGFPNMPDIDVQTLAGSFATATHGAGAGLTAIHDYAIGFRLITAAGDVVDVTEASHPELFAAGKVSLGALGVITQYTLRVVPAFKLLRTVTVMTIEDIMDQAVAAAQSHRGYEFFYLPGTGYGAVLVHDVTDEPDTGAVSDEE